MIITGKGPLLIKFQSREIIESLQSGLVYMNGLGVFINMEEQEEDDEVGDRMEEQIYSTAYVLPSGSACGLRLKVDDGTDNYVFCLFYVSENQESFRFNDMQKKKILKFGDTALVIKDFGEFIHRTVNAAKDKGYEMHHREVSYYDENDEMNMEVTDCLTRGLCNMAFFKRERYQHQQEYRLAVNKERTGEDHVELDIGDISDISVKVSTEQILDEGIDIIN